MAMEGGGGAIAGESALVREPKAVVKGVFMSVMAAVRASHALPANEEEFEYQVLRGQARTKDALAISHAKLCSLIERLAAAHGMDQLDIRPPRDPEESFEAIREMSDEIMEGVDDCVDEILGQNRHSSAAKAVAKQAVYVDPHARRTQKMAQPQRTFDKVSVKPQNSFDDSIDNSAQTAFVPKFVRDPVDIERARALLLGGDDVRKEKPRRGASAAKLESHVSSLGVRGAQAGAAGSPDAGTHPFAVEIEALNRHWRSGGGALLSDTSAAYGAAATTTTPPSIGGKKFASLDNNTCTWVDTEAALEQLASTLNKPTITEFAIDLEAHSYRSYQGFVCLMQISTRFEDFLVDTLALRSHMQAALLPSFTDIGKVKVLHGANMDIIWLQRDFGLYIVNMFDTGQAARVLAFPRFSLAWLLKKFCDVDADKQYQLADWRVRPLSAEMFRYAREDTHYLLYVYDQLRALLAERSSHTPSPAATGAATGGGGATGTLVVGTIAHNGLQRVAGDGADVGRGEGTLGLEAIVRLRSSTVALQQYTKPGYNARSCLVDLAKHSEPLSPVQSHVFKALHAWRDEHARKYDESIGYVLPKYMMLRIAERMPLTEASLLNVVRPQPPILRHHAKAVVLLVQQAVSEASEHSSSSSSATHKHPLRTDAPGTENSGSYDPAAGHIMSLACHSSYGSVSNEAMYRLCGEACFMRGGTVATAALFKGGGVASSSAGEGTKRRAYPWWMSPNIRTRDDAKDGTNTKSHDELLAKDRKSKSAKAGIFASAADEDSAKLTASIRRRQLMLKAQFESLEQIARALRRSAIAGESTHADDEVPHDSHENDHGPASRTNAGHNIQQEQQQHQNSPSCSSTVPTDAATPSNVEPARGSVGTVVEEDTRFTHTGITGGDHTLPASMSEKYNIKVGQGKSRHKRRRERRQKKRALTAESTSASQGSLTQPSTPSVPSVKSPKRRKKEAQKHGDSSSLRGQGQTTPTDPVATGSKPFKAFAYDTVPKPVISTPSARDAFHDFSRQKPSDPVYPKRRP